MVRKCNSSVSSTLVPVRFFFLALSSSGTFGPFTMETVGVWMLLHIHKHTQVEWEGWDDRREEVSLSVTSRVHRQLKPLGDRKRQSVSVTVSLQWSREGFHSLVYRRCNFYFSPLHFLSFRFIFLLGEGFWGCLQPENNTCRRHSGLKQIITTMLFCFIKYFNLCFNLQSILS